MKNLACLGALFFSSVAVAETRASFVVSFDKSMLTLNQLYVREDATKGPFPICWQYSPIHGKNTYNFYDKLIEPVVTGNYWTYEIPKEPIKDVLCGAKPRDMYIYVTVPLRPHPTGWGETSGVSVSFDGNTDEATVVCAYEPNPPPADPSTQSLKCGQVQLRPMQGQTYKITIESYYPN